MTQPISTGPPQSEALLPALRQELTLLPAPRSGSGAPQWFLHDPVRHAFHTLGEAAVKLLSFWGPRTPADILRDLHESDPDSTVTEDDLKAVTGFLYENKLTVDPPGGDVESFARQEAAKRIPLHEMLVHRYLFFRIPLFNPKAFLDTFYAPARLFFKPATWITIAVIGVFGLIFAARQWDEFVTTFLHFFTLEGFVFYAITLAIIKALHELGHAFAARHFGARVPVIGLAFLVMFPILYTDTTDAWRLTNRRARLFIDAGGIMVELATA